MAKVVPMKKKDSREDEPEQQLSKKQIRKLLKDVNSAKFDAEELLKKSKTDFSKAKTNKERLELMLQVLLESIPVAEGLFRTKPSRSAGLLVTNLIGQTQAIMEQLEDKVDYKELAENCFNEVIKPKLEKVVLSLGQVIKKERIPLQNEFPKKAGNRVKTAFDSVYVQYGQYTEEMLRELKDDLFKFMNS